MTKWFAGICVLVAGCWISSVVMAQEKPVAVDPSGTWRWEYELNGESMKDSLKLNIDKDNKVVGIYQGRSEKTIEIKDGKMEGDSLSFYFSVDYQNMPVKLTFKGKIKKDEIDGNVVAETSEGSQDFPWAPKRGVQMDDVVGRWQMKIEADGNTLEPVVTISKDGDKFKANYVSGTQLDVEVINLKIENNLLLFSIDTEVNGTKIKAAYKGRPYGDKIKGSIDYVLGTNSGEIDFTGTRKPIAK